MIYGRIVLKCLLLSLAHDFMQSLTCIPLVISFLNTLTKAIFLPLSTQKEGYLRKWPSTFFDR